MKKERNVAAAALVAGFTFAIAFPCFAGGSHYRAPQISSVGDIPYPPDTLAAGIVSFAVHLDSGGQIQSVKATRDFPPLARAAQTAIHNWTFQPASLNGKQVPSSIPVSVIFNVYNPSGIRLMNLKVSPPAALPPDESQFAPANVTSASFAKYPPNSVSSGTVILDVTVTEAGKPERVPAILGTPPLSLAAIRAVKSWTYTPATFRGRAVASHLVVAFVFQTTNPVSSPTN